MAKVDKWIQELDIADGLKQLLIDAGITIESIVGLDYQEVAEVLHTDPYVGKLIVEATQSLYTRLKSKHRGHI
jgi:hypothetical protein